jgi:hypothetical protein
VLSRGFTPPGDSDARVRTSVLPSPRKEKGWG